jgi:hypothetical protein
LLLAPIEAIGKLVVVACEVFYGNLVECAVNAALEKRESVLNRIGVDFAPCIAGIVIDDAVLSGSARCDYFVGRMGFEEASRARGALL